MVLCYVISLIRIFFFNRINSRRGAAKVGVSAAVGKGRFSFSSEARIEELKKIRMKKRKCIGVLMHSMFVMRND